MGEIWLFLYSLSTGTTEQLGRWEGGGEGEDWKGFRQEEWPAQSPRASEGLSWERVHRRILNLELLCFPALISEAVASAFQARLAAWVTREDTVDGVGRLARPGQESSISILGQN